MGTNIGLGAASIDAAETEALSLPRPDGSNTIQIMEDGRPTDLQLALCTA